MLKAGTQAIARSEMSPAESSASLDLVVMLAQGLEDPLNFLENALNRLVVDLKGSLSEENAHILDHATCSADSLRLFVSQSQDMKLIMSRKPLMPNKNYVSLQSVIEKVMKVTEDTSQTVPIVFENRCGPDVVLWTDGEWLWQMLASAVIDACKTTFEGKIDVNICATGCGHLRFDIIDTGIPHT
jgi:signal transduction histidine kinase